MEKASLQMTSAGENLLISSNRARSVEISVTRKSPVVISATETPIRSAR